MRKLCVGCASAANKIDSVATSTQPVHMTFPERRPRVVIADDHPSVLVAFARMLQPCCEVLATVPNGQEAIDAVDRLRPDILWLT